jgi:5-formyltetrahydrofolate cyclo-ligase
MDKAEIRRAAALARDAIPAETRAAAAKTIAERPLPFRLAAGKVVSGFMPLKSEINPLPLLRVLPDQGAKLALPTIVGRGQPLRMRVYEFGDRLVPGVWNIREPAPEATEVFPDIVLVPLLAFERGGHRVGYGAGYYDLTINALRARKPVLAVGIAFASQEIPAVPYTERDARLDLVLTEREVIDCRKS